MVLKTEAVGQAPWPPWSKDNTAFLFSSGWQCQPMLAGKLRSSGCPGPRGPVSTSLDPVTDPKVELRRTEPPPYLTIVPLLPKLCSVFFFKIISFAKLIFYCSIVDLQHCVNFCCVAKWFSYTYIHILFKYSFPLRFVIGYWIKFLWYIVGLCCLAILYIKICIC